MPCPTPGDLPNRGMNPRLLHSRQILYGLSHHGSPHDPRNTDIKQLHRHLVRFPASARGLAQVAWPSVSVPVLLQNSVRHGSHCFREWKNTDLGCVLQLCLVSVGNGTDPLHAPLSAALRFFKRSGVGGDFEEGYRRPVPTPPARQPRPVRGGTWKLIAM